MSESSSEALRAVVVTGASTGIGRASAVELATLGFRVYGSVRRQADADALRDATAGAVHPILFDVTDEQAVRAAAESLEEELGEAGLAGLVNNAGICVAGPLEHLPMEAFRDQLEVNVFGLLRTTQAFLPLLRRGRGRIVNVSSMSGRMCFPFMGAYNVSKYGVEAITDVLRMELDAAGIHVAAVEPGAVRTPIWERSEQRADAIVASVDDEERARMREHYADIEDGMRVMTEKSAAGAIPVEHAARAISHALTAAKPRARYPVGKDAKRMFFLKKILPTRTLDRLILTNVRGGSR